MNKGFHESVLLKEAVEHLQIHPEDKYIDATLGGGGHSERIVGLGGRVLGIDQDLKAIEYVSKRLGKDRITIVQGNFRDIERIAKENGFENVSGILFDLGVSSHQLDTKERGFSFQKDGPLDMRMDTSLQIRALDLLRVLSKAELQELFTTFGEESRAAQIASEIVRMRKFKPIETTSELAELIVNVYGYKGKIHPGTKVFQALRIAVNDELFSIKEALPKAFQLLESGGRMVVISFHSLEDRIIKEQFKKIEKSGIGKLITKKPIVPGDEEIKSNSRSRSAKMRVIEKV